MTWTPEQDAAMQAVHEWFHTKEKQVFRLFGYAGTGKTTLARHIAMHIPGEVRFAAFTGKAAHVLHMKGCINASTIHALIYNTREKSYLRLKQLEKDLLDARTNHADPRYIAELEAELKHEKKLIAQPDFKLNHGSIIRDASLVIIDECSMVDNELGADLLSFGVPILVLGDPAQLPPIRGKGYFTHGVEPDVMLTEVHRQALDNPIIAMATQVRHGEDLELGTYGDSRVITKIDLDWDEIQQSDQILVGKNITRTAINERIRTLRGLPYGSPVEGDKVICLRNDHDKGLLNGSLWKVREINELDPDSFIMSGDSMDYEGRFEDLHCHSHYFQGRGDDLPVQEKMLAEEFDFGYAITVHKAQGSEWDTVTLFDQKSTFRDDKWRWIYTGITRAAKKIDIIKRT